VSSSERRRYARVRPAADYDVRVQLDRHGQTQLVAVVDLSLGGFGFLLSGTLETCAVGELLDLNIETPSGAPLSARGVVRHVSRSRGVCGVELQNLSPRAGQELRASVEELLARGHGV
jgi:c-di-GMP-binding flagellar brake protein YcgR